MPDIDLKKLDKTDADPKVKEVYRYIKKCLDQDVRKQWLKTAQECDDAVYDPGSIWTEEEKAAMIKKGMIPLSGADLYKGVQGSSAVVTDQKPGVEFLPVGSGDLYVAELMKRAFDQVWAQNDGSTEIFNFVKTAKIGGFPALTAKHDPAKGIYGKVVFGEQDPETLYFDMEKCKKADLSDVSVVKAHLVSRAYAKETYPGIKDEDMTFEGVPKPDEKEKTVDTVTGKDNYTIGAKDTPPADGPDEYPEEREDVWEIEAHMLKRDKEVWLMTPDAQGGWRREIYPESKKADAETAAKGIQGAVLWDRVVEKRYLRIIVGKKLIPQKGTDGKDVDELPNAYGVDVDGDPILPIVGMIHDRSRKGKPVSPTVYAKEAARERYKRRTQSIYVVSKNIDAPAVLPEGSIWKKDDVHGDWIQVGKDAPFSPTRLLPGSTPNEAMNMEAVAKSDLDDIYDMQDVMKGKVPSGRPAMQTILALIDMGGMMSKPFTRALESALVRLGKVVMSCILRAWPRSMWERLIEPDEWGTWKPQEDKPQAGGNSAVEEMNRIGQPPDQDAEQALQMEIREKWKAALEKIRPADSNAEPGLSLIDVDVRVAAGSTMPTNRMAKAEVAAMLVDKKIYDADAALYYIDDPHKEQIIARMKAKEDKMMLMAMSGAQPPRGAA